MYLCDFLVGHQCLVAFLEGPDTDLSLQSLEKVKVCADHLGSGDLKILPPVSWSDYAACPRCYSKISMHILV